MAIPARQTPEEDQALRLHTRHGDIRVAGDTLHLPHPGASAVQLAPGPLALMRALMKAQGAVLSREHLLAVLPHCGSEHALEMWVSRLRHSLPDPGMVKTVVKRGYRLVV
ncbi:winged helix-turn-helix domain-containing protein [Nesterenkonia lutea]|uniref:Uroporphyrinogen-III synthase n=1 Tax=Nesterenkonia lutea TaxID=272919 RepID=A0ABR9JFW1_9MICC|nr:winged helix-turn-helix domain-containing protein [Nesterenkonia lutea]MBE1524826.1 uroporphyrinogen-III synthase [Nesterenkonia lutea]